MSARRTWLPACVATVACVAAPLAQAETAGGPISSQVRGERDRPALDAVVEKHVAARGGKAALAALRSVRMTGRATAGPGRDAIVRREIARPGRIRTEFVFQGTTGVWAWDGAAGWRVSPLDGAFEPQALPAEEAAQAAEQADLDGPLVDWRAKGHSLELVGTTTLPSGEALELKVTLRGGGERRVYVDAASGQIVRVELARRVRGRELALVADFGDFRETGGVSFARRIEIGARGRPSRLRITVDEVETNVAIEEERFRMPKP